MGYNYPPNFPQPSRARVKSAELRARQKLVQAKEDARQGADLSGDLKNYAITVFLVFAEEAFKLGRAGIWTVDLIDAQARQFLADRLWAENLDRFGRRIGEFFDSRSAELKREAVHKFEASREWQVYNDGLIAVSDAQATGAIRNSDGQPEWMKKVPNESSPVRTGYRQQILDWMKAEEIPTVELAARRLGVSKSTLKSIMSEKGKPRYGQERLQTVLRKIGHQVG